ARISRNGADPAAAAQPVSTETKLLWRGLPAFHREIALAGVDRPAARVVISTPCCNATPPPDTCTPTRPAPWRRSLCSYLLPDQQVRGELARRRKIARFRLKTPRRPRCGVFRVPLLFHLRPCPPPQTAGNATAPAEPPAPPPRPHRLAPRPPPPS